MKNRNDMMRKVDSASQKSIVKSRIRVIEMNEDKFKASIIQVFAEYDIIKEREINSRNGLMLSFPVE